MTPRDRQRGTDGVNRNRFLAPARPETMREEAEIREQYEYLTEQLASDEMRHEGVRRMFTHYKRALGWVLGEEHI